MKKGFKILLIVAVGLVILGVGIGAVGLSMAGFDISVLTFNRGAEQTTRSVTIEEPFSDIEITCDVADVKLEKSADKSCVVSYTDHQSADFSAEVEGGKLKITSKDKRKWYERFGLFVRNPKLVVSLPSADDKDLTMNVMTGDIIIPEDVRFAGLTAEVVTGDIVSSAQVSGALSLHAVTGDITVSDAAAQDADLKVTTGDIQIQRLTVKNDLTLNLMTGDASLFGVSCRELSVKDTSGDLSLRDTVSSSKTTATLMTGDILLSSCDASDYDLKITTGSIRGSLLSGKVFSAVTNTGKVSVPDSATGGRCEVSVGTGDISLTVEEN